MSPPSLGPTVEELFEEGIGRLHFWETWKLWKWPEDEKVFYSPDDFKCALIHSLIPLLHNKSSARAFNGSNDVWKDCRWAGSHTAFKSACRVSMAT